MLLESSELRDPVAKLLSGGLPVFGTCAGMILLSSEVIGGRADQEPFGILDIAVRRNGFGRQRESFECVLEVTGLDSGLPAVFIRAPVVERVAEEVEVLAVVDNYSSPTGQTPVLLRQGPVLASAFHPELTKDRRLHRMFIEMI
jgi:5'-phosphate synthase pdxT subunit